MKGKPIEVLKERLREISYLASASAVLGWDQEVHMPAKGADARARASAQLSNVVHDKLVAIDDDKALTRLKKDVEAKKLRGKDAVIVEETWRSFEREKKLPADFVRELSELTAKAQHVWAEARKKDDFGMFLPYLRRIVEMKRKEAKYVGYKDSPYDALLDSYEPGLSAKDASAMLEDLKSFLVPFLKEIRSAKVKVDPKKTKARIPLSEQIAFNKEISAAMGFDFEAGRMDQSTHPFTTTFHPQDVRITTRFREDDLLYSLGSTIHETGHALYEQGLPSEHFGTPLGEAVSLGVHESQSRLWENNIGKSEAFWRHFYPKLQKRFPKPFKTLPFEEFMLILNEVKPSLIRTEADEVTYNLHIIVRFEIEKGMIEGKIDPKDAPKVWREKMKEYLGIEVPSNTLGVLQDVHWSAGYLGYFPTYALGNLYAAQWYAAMEAEIPDLNKKIAKGELSVPREWLRKNVHLHGKTYKAADLLKKVTGEKPISRYFTEYLKKKYGKLYSLGSKK
ncbi:MAG TPA: carboxypeptidase M32 [Candidatus Paceibacterota bacterium]|nr:carboxypeptidase M32 [Candidatus Paceibacterota bacterium]